MFVNKSILKIYQLSVSHEIQLADTFQKYSMTQINP